MAECEHIASGQFPAPGVPGATFVPGVKEVPEGYEVSWENNRNLPNPDPIRLLHGKSAYQLAVEAGYEGTEVEFAAEMADAAVAKAKAEAAAEAAGKSEANAAGSASAAAQSEQNAKDSEEAARQAAGEAEQLVQAAAGSAGSASLSEQNAAASEQAAEDAAEEAGNRAAAAGNAAGAAARSEANAKTSEENAARSEAEARKVAQEAQGVILSGPAQPGQLLLVESVSEDGKLLKCTAVDRTHGEGTPVTVEVLPEATLTIPEDGLVSMATLGLVAGETYTVNWNGTAYECTAVEIADGDITGTLIGNAAAIGGEDNGLPFVMGDIPAQGVAMCVAMDGSTQATVSVTKTGRSIQKLDSKYLDLDWIPTKTTVRKEMLPEITVSGSPETINFDILSLSVGDKVFVTINGTTYTCTVKMLQEYKVIGNLSLMSGGADTGEPFVMVPYISNKSQANILSELDDYTLSISAEVSSYNKLPENYLPVSTSYMIPTSVTEKLVAEEIAEAVKVMNNGGVVNCDYGRVLYVYDDTEQCYMWVAHAHYLLNIHQWYNSPDNLSVKKLLFSANDDYEFEYMPIVLKSPNYTKYKLVVADDGTLSTEAVTT